MSPFTKNLQKFLIFFFTAIPIVLIFAGVMRAKKNDSVTGSMTNQGTTPPAPAVSQAATGIAPTPTTGSITINGKNFQTPYGNVVASITVTNGKITAVSMPQVPNSPPSIYAKPYLIQQALAAGSANIQGVSGATYTSLAFKSSLENAISQAASQGQTVAPKTNTGVVSTPANAPSVPQRYRDDD